ncbi:hypothetical protein, partial [Pantoea vagans]|uniref:hypothetical protein n=1 Tax=Pantoea vagans TaxID=470934 RepID=UPI0019553C7F
MADTHYRFSSNHNGKRHLHAMQGWDLPPNDAHLLCRRKKAPPAGEAARLFGIHKIFATDLKFCAAAFLRTLTAAYSNIIAQLLKLVNTFYATF